MIQAIHRISLLIFPENRRFFLLPVWLLFYTWALAGETDAVFAQLMQTRLAEQSLKNSFLHIQEHVLLGTKIIRKIYALNHYQPIWQPDAVADLLHEINASELDGLNKTDYLIDALYPERKQTDLDRLGAGDRVTQELLLTESLLRLAYHLRFGKVDPISLDPSWNYSKRLDIKDPAQTLFQALKSGQIKALIASERPDYDNYPKLRKILADFLAIEKRGGWPTLQIEQTIKPGQTNIGIPKIRARLRITGDYQKNVNSEYYDIDLEQSIRDFQKRYSLDADGIIGKKTIAAMNVPVKDRINQIRVNLERLRWAMREISDDFLLVDIAGFDAYLMKHGEKVWQEKIVVGKAYAATPIFKGYLKYLEFNPTWTIPPTILKEKILPKLKQDPGYLTKKGYLLLDLQGNPINPKTVDWQTLKGFPYMIRQPAGKNNPLGQVKFIFPNPHFVFLHDTNHRELFDRTIRTFSAGCIRVKNPLTLAKLLLEDDPDWSDPGKIQQIIASGKTKRVLTKRQIPVLITYTTASVNEQGRVIFKPDIYDRDPAILKGLQGPIKVADDVKKVIDKLSVMD